ncbi:MAG: hypothetical protein WBA12_11020 [Catalinimonas sp.]
MPQSRQFVPLGKAARWGGTLLLLGALAYVLRERAAGWSEGLWVPRRGPGLWVALLLVPFNWGWEALKWQRLLRPVATVSSAQALRSVLAGQAAAFFSWPGVGTYLGRLLQLDVPQRFSGGAPLLWGVAWQNALIAVGGGIGGAHLAVRTGYLTAPFAATGAFALTLLTALLFLLGHRWVLRGARWQRWVATIARLSPDDRRWVGFYTAARYAVYNLQFAFLLWAYGVETDPVVTLAGTAFVFFAKTLLPFLNLLGGIGLREAAAVAYFSQWGVPAAPVVMATLSLWLCNAVLPVAAGTCFLSQSRWRTRA